MIGKDVVLYAAGFFDGEGCVIAQSRDHPNGRLIRCSTAQNDRRPLDYLASFFGGNVVLVHNKYNGSHNWVVNGVAARDFLQAIYPYTIVKRADIKSAFEMAGYDLEE